MPFCEIYKQMKIFWGWRATSKMICSPGKLKPVLLTMKEKPVGWPNSSAKQWRRGRTDSWKSHLLQQQQSPKRSKEAALKRGRRFTTDDMVRVVQWNWAKGTLDLTLRLIYIAVSSGEGFKSLSRKGQNKVLGSATKRISLCWITGARWKTFAVLWDSSFSTLFVSSRACSQTLWCSSLNWVGSVGRWAFS